MTEPYVPFLPPSAVVHGYAARALSVWLRDVDVGVLPLERRVQVAATIRAIDLAGEAWMRTRGSVVGTSEQVGAEVGARLVHEFSVDEAAGVLGVSARRVRTLAAEGLGRKLGSVWVLDAAAVLARAESKVA